MKITIISAAYPYRGGIANFANELHKRLSGEHEIRTITFKRQYPGLLFPGKTQYEEDSSLEIPTERMIDSLNPFSWIKTGYDIRNDAPDVLIFQYWMPFFAPAYGKIAKIVRTGSKTKIIAICHNVLPHERKPVDISLTKYFFSAIDRFVLLSSSVEKELRSVIHDADYKVLFHPVYSNFGEIKKKADARKKLEIPERKTILFFGFIRDYKGLDTLMEAAALLKGRLDFTLVIAGEFYSGREKYKAIIENNDLEKNIILADSFIPSDKVKYYFSASDVVVLPYKSATQSGVTQAAFNFHKPVIATDVGGLKEVIHDGENGYLVPPEDPKSLAAAIEKFFIEDREETFSANIKKELDKYSWGKFTEELLQYLNK